MDEASFPRQFEQLEAKIEQLVRACKALQEMKSTLETRVGDLEESLKAKDHTEQDYREEKAMIRSKVDELLGKLDNVLDSA